MLQRSERAMVRSMCGVKLFEKIFKADVGLESNSRLAG